MTLNSIIPTIIIAGVILLFSIAIIRIIIRKKELEIFAKKRGYSYKKSDNDGSDEFAVEEFNIDLSPIKNIIKFKLNGKNITFYDKTNKAGRFTTTFSVFQVCFNKPIGKFKIKRQILGISDLIKQDYDKINVKLSGYSVYGDSSFKHKITPHLKHTIEQIKKSNKFMIYSDEYNLFFTNGNKINAKDFNKAASDLQKIISDLKLN